MAKESVQESTQALDFETFKNSVIEDFKLASLSREASLLGRREVLTGKAKFGIFGDGKELAQLALAKQFKNGDFRSGYYRDQTLMMAIDQLTVQEYFSGLYANTDVELEPQSAGRQMGGHFATRNLDENGDWKNLMEQKNSSSDISPTAGQMPRLLGLALALADSTAPAEQVYVQALGGLRAAIRFPELTAYAGQGLTVARAELVVPVPDNFNPFLLPPTQLFIFRKDSVGGTDQFLPDQLGGAGNIDGSYRPGTKEYRFNITRYVQGVITGAIPDTGVELVPGSNGITANRVVLAGPSHPDRPMRLDLTFTTY